MLVLRTPLEMYNWCPIFIDICHLIFHISVVGVVFTGTKNGSEDICWYLAYLDICGRPSPLGGWKEDWLITRLMNKQISVPIPHSAMLHWNTQTNRSQTNRYRKQTDINPIPYSVMLHWNTQTNRSQTKRRVLIPYSATLYSVLNYTNKLITNKETGVISPCSVVLLSGAHWNWL